MSAVTVQEIVAMIEGLIESDAYMGSISDMQAITALELVIRIKQHGIARPSGPTPVAWAIDTPYGRGYSFADEVIGKWIVEIDANGCSTHPKARHGFNRQASHSEDDYVCECAGFDPYEAGYQDGIWAAWDADGRLLPDGWVLVPKEPTQEMIDAGIMFGTSPTKVSIIWINMLAAAPEVSNEP